MQRTRTFPSREHITDLPVQRLQDSKNEDIKTLNRCPFVTGHLVQGDDGKTTGLEFQVAAWRQVRHGLGRVPVGFFVTNNRQNGAGVGSSTRVPLTRRPTTSTIEMISDVHCFLDLWFF